MSFNKNVFIIFIIICYAQLFFSQNDSTYFQLPNAQKKEKQNRLENKEWLNKISIGGNFAFFASTNASFVDISPLIGYRLTDMILVGAGPVYTYYSSNQYGTRFSFNMYGFRTMGRVYFLQSLFFQTGWDILNRSIYVVRFNTLQRDRVWVQNIWLGGGVRYSVGGNTYMFTSVLFNLNENEYSPYPNPYVQIGIITGF
ncbi:MAG: hypothetical protein KatS3mg027_1302 [Bacteroidia bacterium]|nr:MAG: hypothetical protein KatS3mg027_1302 [Bacteroidia bacterium]